MTAAEEPFYKQTTLTGLSSSSGGKPMHSHPIPKEIGPYKIETLLNKGGMSYLYLGLHPDTKQPLAIKVLSPEYVNHPEMVDRFLKEAQIIAMTDHPNIVRLYGQGQWEKGLYIAMEFIRGVSLRQFIVQQSLSLRRSIDIVLQVAYALCHLHNHGVIHRDLKPENILITEDGEVKVIDFGIAGLHEEKKSDGPRQMIGTPNYMSPEQKTDPRNISFSSDIYSLGVITYELAMGKLSYGVVHSSLLPKGLRKIVEKALAISVKERYQDILEFVTDLSQYLKSGALERDRPGTDQVKEILETLQVAQQNLSVSSLPNWPECDMALTKYRMPGQFGQYFDLFKFPDNSYGILIAETNSAAVEGAVYIAVLRGMIRTLLADNKEVLKLPQFMATINRQLKEAQIPQQFLISFLQLMPKKDQLSYISCGLGALFHIAQGSTTPRKFSSKNPPLGVDPNSEYFETVDNWNLGDTIVLHSLDEALEPQLMQAIAENQALSPQGQAEAVLKKTASLPDFAQQKNQKLLVILQRIA